MTKTDGYPDNNPKTAIGASKPPLHYIPPVAIVHLGLAMENGGYKYGLMNWREFTVSSSVYYDAMLRHLLEWWDGQDAAGDSGVHHLGHVMACAAILLDAEEVLRLNDDRPKIEGGVSTLMARVKTAREAKLKPAPAVPTNNDEFKDWHAGNMPKPGAPSMRHGLRIKGDELWFEDHPIVFLDQLPQLSPSAVDRLKELVLGIEGDQYPVTAREARGA